MAHARLGATFFKASNLGTVLTLVAFIALACTVVAETMVAALVKLATTGHQGTIVTTPPRVTVART